MLIHGRCFKVTLQGMKSHPESLRASIVSAGY